MAIFNMGLTGMLTMCLAYRQRKYGIAKVCVMAAGFFAAVFYLDSIFGLIMGNAAGAEGELVLAVPEGMTAGVSLGRIRQFVGIFISKSIACTILAAAGTIDLDLDSGWDGQEHRGRRWQYLDSLTVGIAVFFVVLGIACLKCGGQDDFDRVLRMFLLLVLLLLFYGSLFVHLKKQREQALQAEAATQKQEAALYLKSVEDQYQRTRELWHDLKNHINLLSLLLQEEKYGELADYLRIFGDDVDTLTIPVKSGNLVVDALLTNKAARAKKENIPVELSLCDLTGLALKPDEICSLLGNLLDNALEANRQVAEGRFLAVECRKRANGYYIKVQNAIAVSGIDGSDAERGTTLSMPQSRKTDRRNQVGHGLGLRSMERVVHACGGELAVERKGDRFTAVVRLPGC